MLGTNSIKFLNKEELNVFGLRFLEWAGKIYNIPS